MAKVKIPKLDKKIVRMKSEINQVLNCQELSDEVKTEKQGILERQLHSMLKTRHTSICDNMDVNAWIKRETISKEWMNKNKEKKPRDIIYCMKTSDSDTPEYITDTENMAEHA